MRPARAQPTCRPLDMRITVHDAPALTSHTEAGIFVPTYTKKDFIKLYWLYNLLIIKLSEKKTSYLKIGGAFSGRTAFSSVLS